MPKFKITIDFDCSHENTKWTTGREAGEIMAAVIMEKSDQKYMPDDFQIDSCSDESTNIWACFEFYFTREFASKAKAILFTFEAKKKIKSLWEQEKEFIDGARHSDRPHSIEEIE